MFSQIFQYNLVNTTYQISKHPNLLNNLSVPFHFLGKPPLPYLYPSAPICRTNAQMSSWFFFFFLNFLPLLNIPFLESYFFLFLGLSLHLVGNILSLSGKKVNIWRLSELGHITGLISRFKTGEKDYLIWLKLLFL